MVLSFPFAVALLLTNHRNLPASALEALVEALLDELPDDDNPAVPAITVKTEGMPSSPPSTPKVASKRPAYDPAIVYILEFSTVIALRNNETIDLLGKRVSEALQAVLRESGRYHSILVARAAFYQFSILKASYVS